MLSSSPSRARAIHDSALVVDLHIDTASRILDEGVDIAQRLADGQVDLPRMEEGGVDAAFFACWIEPAHAAGPAALKRALAKAEALTRAVEALPERIGLARTAADVRRIVAAGRRAAVLAVEGGFAVVNDLAPLRALHAAGARYMTLTWNNHTAWADGCREAPRHGGLTDFGREVVREMNRLGMMVDVSHASPETVRDALAASSAPVVATHSNARALCDHPRNLTDGQISAIAAKGGVIGVNLYASFLDAAFARAESAAEQAAREAAAAFPPEVRDDPARLKRAKRAIVAERLRGVPRPGIETVCRHIDRIAKIGGIDAVAIGTDYDGAEDMAEGLGDCSKLPALTVALLERGYSEGDVRKVLGENVLRVMARVFGN